MAIIKVYLGFYVQLIALFVIAIFTVMQSIYHNALYLFYNTIYLKDITEKFMSFKYFFLMNLQQFLMY
jgi:hypothetical protein